MTDLHALVEEMRGRAFWFLDETLQREVMRAWADKLESLAGEYAVVPREPTETMVTLGRHGLALAMDTCDFAVCARYTYLAMIEAAERQEPTR